MVQARPFPESVVVPLQKGARVAPFFFYTDGMLMISSAVSIPEHEIQLSAVRASGPGGQHVNKVSSAVHLRFDIHASSLPELYKAGLLALNDRRINRQGVLIIKAQRYRSQEKNRDDALQRLQALVRVAGQTQRKRIPTRPGRAVKQRRLAAKLHHGKIKRLRQKPRLDE